MEGKTVLILGAGVGGIVVANLIRRKLPRSHRVVLVERNKNHVFAPSLLWLMVGDRRPENIVAPLRSLVRNGVDVVHAEINAINVERRQVDTTLGAHSYDTLVIALGSELAPDLIPGLTRGSYSFYEFEETKRLRQALLDFKGGEVSVVVSALPYKCPGAPHEAAMLIAGFFRKRGLKEKVSVRLYTPEPQPMPVAGPQLGEAVKQMLASKGISFHPSHKLVSVDSDNNSLLFEGKDPVPFDLLVAIPPHRGPRVARDAGLVNESGWIPVDRHTLKTKYDNVYAIGDATAISIPGRWKPDVPMMLPKAGVFAHAQAEIVAQRIVDEIDGVTSKAEFCGPGYCMLEAGEGSAGFAFGDFFAEPSPKLELRNIGRAWHFGKVLFEQWWLAPFGLKKSLLGAMITVGGRIIGLPVKT